MADPLVHFVLLGALIFLASGWLEADAESADYVDETRAPIAVTTHLRESLVEDRFRRTGERPAGEDLDDLIGQYVRDETLYREARRLGLDRGDTIVRRRVIQKMEFLLQSAAEVPPATDEALEAYLEAHRESFTTPARYAFEHIFLSRDARGEALAADGAALMQAIAGGGEDERPPGDPFLLGATFPLATEADLAGRLGVDFAAGITAAPEGRWVGPLESSYGLHAVRVTAREPERTAGLDEVRRTVERAWAEDERRRLADEAIEELVASYPLEEAP